MFSKLKALKNFIKDHCFLFSFISGLIYAAPFMWEWLFPFTFISFTLFFYILKCDEKKGYFRSFFLFFLGTYIIVYTLFFKLYPFEGFDFTPSQGKAIVIFAWLGASLIHAFIGGAILSISRFFRDKPLFFAISCGALWVISEYALSLGDLAFPWVTVSVSLIKFLPFLQTSSLFGNGFITFITVLSCCCLAIFLKNRSQKMFLKITAVVLILNTITGSLLFLLPESKGEKVSVCIIQGNVSMGDKWDSDNLKIILKTHEDLMTEALDNNPCDITLLAETVFPLTFIKDGYIHTALSKIAEKYDTTIILGVILKGENSIQYNAMIAIYPDGTLSEPYNKRKLVPFGEKTPSLNWLGKIFPSLNDLILDSSYVEGDKCTTITSDGGIIFGPLVCYDSVFSEFSRENVKNGSEIIAISTNDSWYKDGAAVSQHRSHSIIRAIETGRYVFRSANTGISCIITPRGVVTKETGIMTNEYLCGTGYALDNKTLYVILGNVSLYLSILSIPILMLLKKIRLHG